jgi:hypothetical protein
MTDLQSFRTETRDWLEANCPPEMREPMRSEADACWGGRNATFQSDAQRQWMERMGERGWTVPHWPKDYGGGGLSTAETKVLKEEMARIGARSALTSFGISMLGPALLKFGTEEQKEHFLPQIARGEIRPRRPGDQGRGQGRALADQRPEGVDQLCRQGGLDLLPCPHLNRIQASGHQLRPVRHDDAGRVDQADQADQR